MGSAKVHNPANLVKTYRNYIVFLGILGIGISYYSIVVNYNKLRDPSYRALCDISESIRCSDVLTSVYSKGLGVLGSVLHESSPLVQSNGVYGLIMYSAFVVTCVYPSKILAKLQLTFAIMACVVTVYLAYILFVVLEEVCLVCVSTYLINLVLLIFSGKYLGAIQSLYLSKSGEERSKYLDGKLGKKKV